MGRCGAALLIARDGNGDGQVADHVDHGAEHIEQPVFPDDQADPFGGQPVQRQHRRHGRQRSRGDADGSHARQRCHAKDDALRQRAEETLAAMIANAVREGTADSAAA